jgi:hypothetical protein
MEDGISPAKIANYSDIFAVFTISEMLTRAE